MSDDAWKKRLRSQLEESDRSWTATFLISLLFGLAGGDRFFLHQFVLGSLKLITIGGLGMWWVADLVLLVAGQMTDADGGKVVPPWKLLGQRRFKMPKI